MFVENQGQNYFLQMGERGKKEREREKRKKRESESELLSLINTSK